MWRTNADEQWCTMCMSPFNKKGEIFLFLSLDIFLSSIHSLSFGVSRVRLKAIAWLNVNILSYTVAPLLLQFFFFISYSWFTFHQKTVEFLSAKATERDGPCTLWKAEEQSKIYKKWDSKERRALLELWGKIVCIYKCKSFGSISLSVKKKNIFFLCWNDSEEANRCASQQYFSNVHPTRACSSFFFPIYSRIISIKSEFKEIRKKSKKIFHFQN